MAVGGWTPLATVMTSTARIATVEIILLIQFVV